jgi:hypothetical protein
MGNMSEIFGINLPRDPGISPSPNEPSRPWVGCVKRTDPQAGQGIGAFHAPYEDFPERTHARSTGHVPRTNPASIWVDDRGCPVGPIAPATPRTNPSDLRSSPRTNRARRGKRVPRTNPRADWANWWDRHVSRTNRTRPGGRVPRTNPGDPPLLAYGAKLVDQKGWVLDRIRTFIPRDWLSATISPKMSP